MHRLIFTRTTASSRSRSTSQQVVTGRFPRRALNLVLEWYSLHQKELEDDWHLAQQKLPLVPIPPLE